MRFLFGSFRHAIDTKGRVSIPQRFRKGLLTGKARGVTVLRGFEGCLFCYATPTFEKILERLSEQSFDRSETRELIRWLSENGSEVDVDAQGRIPLTEEQRRAADLDREALLLGAGSRIEIWSPSRFEARPGKSDGAALAEGVLHEVPRQRGEVVRTE